MPSEAEKKRLREKYSWKPGEVIVRPATEAENAQVAKNLKGVKPPKPK